MRRPLPHLGAAVIGLLSAAAAARAESALERYARAIATGDYGVAHEQISSGDVRAMGRETFVARYRALSEVAWLAPVLRSARAEGDALTAIDWTYTRFARAGVLRDPEELARLPRRRYLAGARLRDGKLALGLVPEPAEGGAAVSVGAPSKDWFALYAVFRPSCPRGARALLVDLVAAEARAAMALECRGVRGPEEAIVSIDLEPARFLRAALTARVAGALLRRPPPDPFRAPAPELVGHPAFPVSP